jgi:hypothetical protein
MDVKALKLIWASVKCFWKPKAYGVAITRLGNIIPKQVRATTLFLQQGVWSRIMCCNFYSDLDPGGNCSAMKMSCYIITILFTMRSYISKGKNVQTSNGWQPSYASYIMCLWNTGIKSTVIYFPCKISYRPLLIHGIISYYIKIHTSISSHLHHYAICIWACNRISEI